MRTLAHLAWLIRTTRIMRVVPLATLATLALAIAPAPWWVAATGPVIGLAVWTRLLVRDHGWRRAPHVIQSEYDIRSRWESACYKARLDSRAVLPVSLWRGKKMRVDSRKTGEDRFEIREVPRIRRIRHYATMTIVEAERMRRDDSVWAASLAQLGDELRLPNGQFRSLGERTVSLKFGRHSASHIRTWTTKPASAPANLNALPVARTLSGGMTTLDMLSGHTLIVGETGSGKSSAIWSIVAAMADDIRAGRVELWGIDLKGGVELSLGRQVFTRFLEPGPDRAARVVQMMQDFTGRMYERQAEMAGSTRKHKPSPGSPFILLIIDEFLALSTNRAMKDGYDELIEILSQGRAGAMGVLAATQIAQKENLGSIRDLFNLRMGLRMVSASQVRMAMGDSALELGANCHLIDPDHPGTLYMFTEGGGVEMCRFPWWSDDALKALPSPPARNLPAAREPHGASESGTRRTAVVPMRKAGVKEAREWIAAQSRMPTASDVQEAIGVSAATAYRALKSVSQASSQDQIGSADPTGENLIKVKSNDRRVAHERRGAPEIGRSDIALDRVRTPVPQYAD